MTCGGILQQRKATTLTSLHLKYVKKIQGGSSPTMISEWGVTTPPLWNRMVQKIQGGSSPTLISEWGVTPLYL